MKICSIISILFLSINLYPQTLQEGIGVGPIALGLKPAEVTQFLGNDFFITNVKYGFIYTYKHEFLKLHFDEDSVLSNILFPPEIDLITSKGLHIKEGLTMNDVFEVYGYRDWILSDEDVAGYDIGIIFYHDSVMVTQIEIEEQGEDYIDVAVQEYLDEVYIPKNLDECITALDRYFNRRTIREIREMSEKEFITSTHFGLGKDLRNRWGLWLGSRLTLYFNALGISHPDDMSGIILTSYHRYLNERDIELDRQIEKYQAYWKKVQSIDLSDEKKPQGGG